MSTPDAPPPKVPGQSPPAATAPGGPPRPTPPAPGKAPAPFEVHRSGAPAGYGPSLGPDRRVRMLLALGVMFAFAWGIHWFIFGRPGPVFPLLPPVIDQVKLGMTVADLERIGGRARAATNGGEVDQVTFSKDFKQGNIQVASGEWIDARTRFDAQGKLIRFEVDVGPHDLGAPIGLKDLLMLTPVLAEAKMLRRPYPLADVEDALGPGKRVGRILDASTGEEVVYRWDVDAGGQSRNAARFEVHARGGIVVEHRMTSR